MTTKQERGFFTSKYGKGYYKGMLHRVLQLQADLPDAFNNANYFLGYTDGYMLHAYTEPRVKIILEKVFSAIDYS